MISVKRLTRWTAGALLSTAFFTISAHAQSNIKLSDPEIASVAVTANQIDVGYGKIALKKSKNAEIRKFAQTMITDHSAVIAQAVTLAKKLGVTPKDNALTRQLLEGADKTKKSLNAKSGNSFNKAYIDNEVAYHQAVISAVNNILIPQTQNQELKGLLEKVAPVLKEHLEHAKMVQATFKN